MGPGSHLRSWVYPGAPARSRMPRHDSRTQLRHRSRRPRPAPRDRLRRDRHGHRRRRQPRRHQHRLADRPAPARRPVRRDLRRRRPGAPQDHRDRPGRRGRVDRLVVLPEERGQQREPLRRLPRQRHLRRGRADVHQQRVHDRRQGAALPVLDQRGHRDHPARRHRAHPRAELVLDDHPQGARRAEPGREPLRGQVRPRRGARPRRRDLRPVERRVRGPQHRPRRRALHRARPAT